MYQKRLESIKFRDESRTLYTLHYKLLNLTKSRPCTGSSCPVRTAPRSRSLLTVILTSTGLFVVASLSVSLVAEA